MPVYEFGPFLLNPAERRLLCDGRPVPLTGKVFDILLLLVENSGHLVEKESLMKSVWRDSIVEDNNLTVSMSALRKALGESPGGPQHIETVPRRGYRFIAEVREIGDERDERAEGKSKSAVSRAGEDGKFIRTLAVLPLVNESESRDLEYLSDGITESIISSLSKIPELRVMARNTVFRYKGREVDARSVGRDLGVGAVMVGRLNQFSDSLMIYTELIDVADGSQIWGERYSRQLSNVLDVQEEIADVVSERLRPKPAGDERRRLTKRYTENVEAYRLYLKGRYFWNKYSKEWVTRGVEFFEQAIELDPSYALAYAGLADCYQRLSTLSLPPAVALSRAKAAAMKAVEIDDELAEAHASLGQVKIYYDHDWSSAAKEYERALELAPGASFAHERYGCYLMYTGRFDESIVELEAAQTLDPLSLRINVTLASVLYLMGRHEQALTQAQKIIEMEPDYFPARFVLGWMHIQQRNIPQAIAEFEYVCRPETDTLALSYIGVAHAVSGRRREAEAVLAELQEVSKQKYVSPYSMANLHISLGDRERALDWLEKMYDECDDWLVWLAIGPELDGLRTDPRFKDLLRRVGFTS